MPERTNRREREGGQDDDNDVAEVEWERGSGGRDPRGESAPRPRAPSSETEGHTAHERTQPRMPAGADHPGSSEYGREPTGYRRGRAYGGEQSSEPSERGGSASRGEGSDRDRERQTDPAEEGLRYGGTADRRGAGGVEQTFGDRERSRGDRQQNRGDRQQGSRGRSERVARGGREQDARMGRERGSESGERSAERTDRESGNDRRRERDAGTAGGRGDEPRGTGGSGRGTGSDDTTRQRRGRPGTRSGPTGTTDTGSPQGGSQRGSRRESGLGGRLGGQYGGESAGRPENPEGRDEPEQFGGERGGDQRDRRYGSRRGHGTQRREPEQRRERDEE